MKKWYPAIVDTNEARTVFGVTFPDFPGCTTVGDTLDEALTRAEEALGGHVALMLRDGDAIPDPTPALDVAGPDPEILFVGLSLVSVILPGRAKKISITMDEDLLGEIDAAAGNRSGFLAEAARNELARRRA